MLLFCYNVTFMVFANANVVKKYGVIEYLTNKFNLLYNFEGG